MAFINPLEILELGDFELHEISPALIKKHKRKVFADIELSDDGLLTYGNQIITKSDLEAAVHQLEDIEILGYYYFLSQNINLLKFLSDQDDEYFFHFRKEAIFQIPSFIQFISPFFATSYDAVLYDLYMNGDTQHFINATSAQLLIIADDYTIAYKKMLRFLNNIRIDLDRITTDIRNDTSPYDGTSIEEIFQEFETNLNVIKINHLPIYFQEIRNQIGMSLRGFSINIFNKFENCSKLSLQIIEFASSFDVNGLTKQELNKALADIEDLVTEQNIQKKAEATLQKYLVLLKEGDQLANNIDSRKSTGEEALTWIQRKINFSELESLSESLDEVRNQVSLLLQRLSVSVWNKWNDADTAIIIIEKSISIHHSNADTTRILNDGLKKLKELQRDKLLASLTFTPGGNSRRTTSPSKPDSKSNSGCLIIIVILVLVYIIGLIVKADGESKSKVMHYSGAADIFPDTTVPIIDTVSTSQVFTSPPTTVSAYAGNSLNDGTSPYLSCFGSGEASSNSWIRINNDSSSDAIVCLVNNVSGVTIRNKYIKAFGKYKMKHIPIGSYYIKIYSGNDWNPHQTNFYCNTKGDFDNNKRYSDSQNVYNPIDFKDDGYTFTTYDVALSSILDNSASESTQESFFK